MLLELEGHQVRLAHTGPDALTVAGEFQPDVVLLDIGLPGLNGFEVARAIRADNQLPQPLLVAVTGWGADQDRRQTHEAGFDRHLVKPVSHLMLLEALASAAARHA
ncbi:MAG: response regulator [Pseudomonadota bacterium]|nr:response regulator [Pseudomonadota bacterium]